MDTRELFQRFNLHKVGSKPKYDLEPLVNSETGDVEWYYPKLDEKGIFTYQKISPEQAKIVRSRLEQLAGSTEDIRELTSKIDTNLFVVDELPNCVPAVRAQLFNLFDGFIEINGRPYPIGNGYSVGIATGNIGQQFTESSNDLGRAIKDRMHVIVDTDHFFPNSGDTLEILAGNTNPRVEFTEQAGTEGKGIIERYDELKHRSVPLTKLIVANYLLHGLDYCVAGGNPTSKRRMKGSWPNEVDNHGQGSDEALVFPVSPRAAKSIIGLSQSLDDIALQRGVPQEEVDAGAFKSMMQAYRLVSACSGVLNEAMVRSAYGEDNYTAIDAVIATTGTEFENNKGNIASGLHMVGSGKTDKKVMDLYTGRWQFMRDTLDRLSRNRAKEEK
jgi:hypothetical protein